MWPAVILCNGVLIDVLVADCGFDLQLVLKVNIVIIFDLTLKYTLRSLYIILLSAYAMIFLICVFKSTYYKDLLCKHA